MAQGTTRRPGARRPDRRLPVAAALAVWLAAGCASLAFAQADPFADEGAPADSALAGTEEAGPDTAAVSKMLGNLSPTYSTAYNVTQQTSSWGQNFDFGRSFSFMDFTNKTDFTIRTESGRNETRRSGGDQLSLRWLVIPKLPLSTSFEVNRDSITRPGDERQSHDASVSLGTVYVLKMGRRLRHTLTGGAGYSRRTDISVRDQDRSESRDFGPNGNFSWRGKWTPSDALSFDGNISDNRKNKTSKLQKTGGEVETRPTRNQSRSYRLSFDYNPAPWLSGKASAGKNSGNDEYFIVQVGQGDLEQKVNDSRSLNANLILKPIASTTLTLNAAANDRTLGYSKRTDYSSSGNGANWSANLKTSLLKVSVDATLSHSRDVFDPASLTTPATTNGVSQLEGKISRVLSPKIQLDLNWFVRTSQLFFTEPDSVNPGVEWYLDKDERRVKFQPILTYTPGNKWKVTASYTRSTSRQIQLNPKRANQTQDEQDYTVDMNISYQLSEATGISQSYSIKALYTTFDFAAVSNRLLSTQRIVSSLNSAITPKVYLTLEHRFTLQDSGPFSFDASGARVFARSLRKYRQELTTDVQYQLLPWLSLGTNSRFLRTDDVNEATDRRTVFRNLELKMGGKIKKPLGQDASLDADASFVRSNIQKSYWSLTSSLTKEF